MSDEIYTGGACSAPLSSSLDYDEFGAFGENIKYECYPSTEPFKFSYDDIRVYREIHHNSKVSVVQLARMLSMSENGVRASIAFLKKHMGLERIRVGNVWYWQYSNGVPK